MTKEEKDNVYILISALMDICGHDFSEEYHGYDDEPNSRKQAAVALNKWKKTLPTA